MENEKQVKNDTFSPYKYLTISEISKEIKFTSSGLKKENGSVALKIFILNFIEVTF